MKKLLAVKENGAPPSPERIENSSSLSMPPGPPPPSALVGVIKFSLNKSRSNLGRRDEPSVLLGFIVSLGDSGSLNGELSVMLVRFETCFLASSDYGEKQKVCAGSGNTPRIDPIDFRFDTLAFGTSVSVYENSGSLFSTVERFLSASLNSARIMPLKSECFKISSGWNSSFGRDSRFTISLYLLNARYRSRTTSSSNRK